MAIDEIFTSSPKNDLAGNRYLSVFFEADWGLSFVAVVEDDSDTGFGDARLATFVDEVLIFP